jgi:hypothetical protein
MTYQINKQQVMAHKTLGKNKQRGKQRQMPSTDPRLNSCHRTWGQTCEAHVPLPQQVSAGWGHCATGRKTRRRWLQDNNIHTRRDQVQDTPTRHAQTPRQNNVPKARHSNTSPRDGPHHLSPFKPTQHTLTHFKRSGTNMTTTRSQRVPATMVATKTTNATHTRMPICVFLAGSSSAERRHGAVMAANKIAPSSKFSSSPLPC